MTKEEEVVSQGRTALARMLEKSGPDDPKTLEVHRALGRALYLNGNYPESKSILQEVLARQHKTFASDSDDVLRTEQYLAAVHYRLGEYVYAKQLLSHVVETASTRVDDDSWPLNPGLLDLARTLWAMGEFEKEVPLRKRILASYERLLPPEDNRILGAKSDLAAAMRSSGDFEGAYTLDMVLVKEQARVPDNRSVSLGTQFNLAVDLAGLGRIEEAERLGYDTYQAMVRELSPDDPIRLRVEPFDREFKRYGRKVDRR